MYVYKEQSHYLLKKHIRKTCIPRQFFFPQSSFPTATYFRLNGSGCPIAALMEPHFEVGSPLANSSPSRASYNQDFQIFKPILINKKRQSNNIDKIKIEICTCTKGKTADVSTSSLWLTPTMKHINQKTNANLLIHFVINKLGHQR